LALELAVKDPARIVILTPVKDAARHLERYVANLKALEHPRTHLSLGLLEGDSRDDSFARLTAFLPDLQAIFHRVGLWKRDFGFQMPEGVPRWSPNHQLMRRSVLARSRNHLLFRALDDEDWVLWLDVDVEEYPADIIGRLLATRRSIITPNCVTQYGGQSFDRNAWRGPDDRHLSDLRQEGDLVRLDSVGGTMLLIRADLHRDGLIFPPFPYGRGHSKARRHHFEIETEGLGLIARDLGHQCWGMPNLEIKHYDG
jgi:hypothetical protein